MTYKENVRAILECHFSGFKEEIIESACNRILEQEERDIKTGHWIKHNNEGVITIQCPVCGKVYLRCLINYFNYCPFCGEHLLEKDTKGIYRK